MKNKKNYLILPVICVIIFMVWYFFLDRPAVPDKTYDVYTGGKTFYAEPDITQIVIFKASISGEVLYPGVYEFIEGDRVADLIEMAGGVTDGADLTYVQLAQRLRDEQNVVIPATGAVLAPEASAGLVDLNRATAAELCRLPGIGEKTAEAVIAYRDKNGAFKSVEDIMNVPGIGEAKFSQIKDYIVVR